MVVGMAQVSLVQKSGSTAYGDIALSWVLLVELKRVVTANAYPATQSVTFYKSSILGGGLCA